MAEEHLVYQGGDWKSIAEELPMEEPFTWYLQEKARHSCRQFGPERPFGETVAEEKARTIRNAARRRNAQEVKGDAG